jgi:hypothetical protein
VPSVIDYLLVAHDRVRVEHYTRGRDALGCCADLVRGCGSLALPSSLRSTGSIAGRRWIESFRSASHALDLRAGWSAISSSSLRSPPACREQRDNDTEHRRSAVPGDHEGKVSSRTIRPAARRGRGSSSSVKLSLPATWGSGSVGGGGACEPSRRFPLQGVDRLKRRPVF